MAVIDIAGFVADLKDHAVEHGFHVHDERHFVETYSLRQLWEVDLHPEEACSGPIDLHLSLEVDPRALLGFEDEVIKLDDVDADPPEGFNFLKSVDVVVMVILGLAMAVSSVALRALERPRTSDAGQQLRALRSDAIHRGSPITRLIHDDSHAYVATALADGRDATYNDRDVVLDCDRYRVKEMRNDRYLRSMR